MLPKAYEKTLLKYLTNVNWRPLARHQEQLFVLFLEALGEALISFVSSMVNPAFIPVFGRNGEKPGSDTDLHSPCQGVRAHYMILPAGELPFLHLTCRHSKLKK